MRSEIETAIKRAGLKLGGGLLLLAALIGVRIVTAQPGGIESQIAELEQHESEVSDGGRMDPPAAVPKAEAATAATADAETSGSRLSGLGLSRGESSGASGSSPRGADRLVSCELRGSVQFMRGADCATRGGRATDLD